jgi:hypothetical protein
VSATFDARHDRCNDERSKAGAEPILVDPDPDGRAVVFSCGLDAAALADHGFTPSRSRSAGAWGTLKARSPPPPPPPP